jgi:predicted permease
MVAAGLLAFAENWYGWFAAIAVMVAMGLQIAIREMVRVNYPYSNRDPMLVSRYRIYLVVSGAIFCLMYFSAAAFGIYAGRSVWHEREVEVLRESCDHTAGAAAATSRS